MKSKKRGRSIKAWAWKWPDGIVAIVPMGVDEAHLRYELRMRNPTSKTLPGNPVQVEIREAQP